MNRTRTIYFLSAIVLIIGCYALNLSYSLFVQTESKQAVDASVPELNYNLELVESLSGGTRTTNSVNMLAKTKQLVKIKVENNGETTIKYGVSVADAKGTTIQLVDRDGNSIVGELESLSSKEVWVFITNDTSSNINNITFNITAIYNTLEFDETTFINDSNIDCTNLYTLDEPNEPVILDGMIPVIYDDSSNTWLKADTDSLWYDYYDRMWANAVTVTSSSRSKYISASPGTPILMSDINSMWVWIPRYKYRITSNVGSSSTVASPPQIDVDFETGTATTGVSLSTSGVATTSYYTHPAFRKGSSVYKSSAYDQGGWTHELTGFWAGKFELSGTASSGYQHIETVTIIPGGRSLARDDIDGNGYNIEELYTASLKFTQSGNVFGLPIASTSTTDASGSHMIKNTEWGAIAYLSQSFYGKMGNNNYTSTNKEIYYNNSSLWLSGRSSGTPTGTATDYGTYAYNNLLCSTSTCSGTETINAGVGASTSGTVYGIYDMNGGGSEYVMSYSTSVSSAAGFGSTVSDGVTHTKWADVPAYHNEKYTSSSNASGYFILGDATYETKNWYDDYSGMFSSSGKWYRRGGSSSDGSSLDSGIFNHGVLDGAGPIPNTVNGSATSTRIILIP